MEISVIIPYRGEKRYLEDCLTSLEEQTFRDFQVILVGDHCQADVSGVNLDIMNLEMTEKSGVAAARNYGLAHATGTYVYFLDCDDYIEKDALEQMMTVSADIVYGSRCETWYKRQVYYENGQELDQKNSHDDVMYTSEDKKPGAYFFPIGKPMDSVSVHSVLFRREYLDEKKIAFQEDLRYMADYPFIVAALAGTDHVVSAYHSLYIKRKHNDPINLPSLLQTKENTKKYLECIRVYQENEELPDAKISNRMGHQFIDYIAAAIGPYMRECGTTDREAMMSELTDAARKVRQQTLSDESRYHRSLVNTLANAKSASFIKKIHHRQMLQTLKRIMISRAQMKKFLYHNLFTKMSLKEDTVLLESFFGKSYSDSPKYIFQYLNEHFPGKYKYVWIMNDKKKLPYPAKQIKRFSFRYFYYLARCKYIVFNSRQPVYFVKRPGNVFLETWHGTPLKKLVFDMEEVTTASPLYKEQFYIQTRSWDYLVAPNEFSAEIFGHAFMYDGPLLRTGYPRNDILYREDKDEIASQIKKRLQLPADKKIALYAPTWRDDEFYGSGQYKFTLQLELDKMKKRLGDDWIVLLRTHYFVADFLDVSAYGDFVYNVSKYDDIAELYLISDVLITDYSSVFFDYANLRRPMLFYTYDLEKYRDVLRGFYIDMEEELPGPLLFTTEEVMDAMENLPQLQKDFEGKYKQFCDKFCDFENGHATENIVNTVFH